MLKQEFITELKQIANGDGSNEYRDSLEKELKEVSYALENKYEVINCIKKYGRVRVALCIATTMLEYSSEYESHKLQWAKDVMRLWTNRSGVSTLSALFNMHPANISDNSKELRESTII